MIPHTRRLAALTYIVVFSTSTAALSSPRSGRCELDLNTISTAKEKQTSEKRSESEKPLPVARAKSAEIFQVDDTSDMVGQGNINDHQTVIYTYLGSLYSKDLVSGQRKLIADLDWNLNTNVIKTKKAGDVVVYGIGTGEMTQTRHTLSLTSMKELGSFNLGDAESALQNWSRSKDIENLPFEAKKGDLAFLLYDRNSLANYTVDANGRPLSDIKSFGSAASKYNLGRYVSLRDGQFLIVSAGHDLKSGRGTETFSVFNPQTGQLVYQGDLTPGYGAAAADIHNDIVQDTKTGKVYGVASAFTERPLYFDLQDPGNRKPMVGNVSGTPQPTKFHLNLNNGTFVLAYAAGENIDILDVAKNKNKHVFSFPKGEAPELNIQYTGRNGHHYVVATGTRGGYIALVDLDEPSQSKLGLAKTWDGDNSVWAVKENDDGSIQLLVRVQNRVALYDFYKPGRARR